MKLNPRNWKPAGKYRRTLWKYRTPIRQRRKIAGMAAAGMAIAAGGVAKRALRA